MYSEWVKVKRVRRQPFGEKVLSQVEGNTRGQRAGEWNTWGFGTKPH